MKVIIDLQILTPSTNKKRTFTKTKTYKIIRSIVVYIGNA